MNPIAEFFLSAMGIATRTNLGSVIFIHFGKINPALPTHPLQDSQKLTSVGGQSTLPAKLSTKSSIQSVLTQHSFSPCPKVNILNENHASLVTEFVRQFKVKVFPGVVISLMQSSNLLTESTSIGGAFNFVFQLALHASFAGSTATPQTRLAVSAHVAIPQKILGVQLALLQKLLRIYPALSQSQSDTLLEQHQEA